LILLLTSQQIRIRTGDLRFIAADDQDDTEAHEPPKIVNLGPEGAGATSFSDAHLRASLDRSTGAGGPASPLRGSAIADSFTPIEENHKMESA